MERKGYGGLKIVAAMIMFFALQFGINCSSGFAQEVSGTVVDAESGETLPGVNVTVKGTTVGVATDGQGTYSLTVPSLNDTLLFSFVGYEIAEIPINGRTTVDVSLESEAIMGEDVVVVGYGTQQKSDLTGSVGTVDEQSLQERSSTNVSQALAGKISGVDVSLSSGEPGGSPQIRIRGSSSVSNTNDPLYVVDGVILNVERMQQGTHAINSIPPSSIESIEVLKDASATAIYGARGANGVVLITTKKGSREGPRVNYSGSVSTSSVAKKIDVLNAEEFLRVEEIAYSNAEKYDPAGFAAGKYTNPVEKRTDPRLFDQNGNPIYDTDWQDEAFRQAITQKHNLSVAGGDKQTTYGVYVSYNDEEGVMKDSWLERYSGKFNIETQVTEWLSAGGSMTYSNQSQKELHPWSMRMLYESIAIVPVKYPDGTWAGNEDYPGMEGGPNQRRVSEESIHILDTQNILANLHTTIQFSEKLELRTMLGTNVINQEQDRYSGRTLPFLSRDQDGVASISPSRSDNWQFENLLNYTDELNEVHSISALLGQSIQTSSRSSSSASAWGFLDDYFEYNNLGIADNPRPPNSTSSKYTMSSYFSRLNYTYDDKYLVTVTGRVDGSSRFGTNNRYAFFPSAALGWRVSEEGFLQDNATISNLKLRASYGLTGNSEIANYQYEAGLGTYTAIFNGTRNVGVGVQRLANPDLKWEINKQFDIGLELGLFNNRVALEADVYRRKSEDMLLQRPLPRTSGYATVFENIGSMENRGIELALTTNNIRKSDFSWTTEFNISINENEVLKLHGGSDIETGGGVHGGGAGSIIREGLPVNTFMGYVSLGTWNTDEAEEAARYNRLPGDIKYKDVNNDGAINQDDRVPIGNGVPDGYGSFINSFTYRNFEATADIQFMYGNDVMWEAVHSTEDRVGIANSLGSVLNAWTPENQDTPIAQLRPTQAGYDTDNDTHRMQDGSFIRGRNFTLSYNLPQSTIQPWGARNIRVYAAAQNLFVITEFRGYDPEVSTSGSPFSRGRAQYFEYPKSRTFVLGLDIGF
ncbi:SusC/RagA family TonB-linked outer membrane protein [Fodinibius sediminis]|uniref:TonB-linked outer membrane protein, SusC/RagA family n=1 Tax=Fodinibius sediminis TaxID=1214077 RepID=A0A521BNI6_9BACT|nr:TonB-dependent receptor [Fodinibius sediminis]SMO48724.1 TonB-linked outer membrane protein, SusC/RagA family [Fodinibius sediminis]